MDLRGGLGLREYRANGLLRLKDVPETAALEFQVDPNRSQIGPEIALLATARLTRYVQLTTDFDSLLSFKAVDEVNQTQFKWRNTINFRLASYASLAYTLNLNRLPALGLSSPLTYEQGIQLRVAFTPF
jgi:hypothetical protein